MIGTENHVQQFGFFRTIAFFVCPLILCFFAIPAAPLFAQGAKKGIHQRKSGIKTLKQLEAEGNPNVLAKRYKQITKRLNRQLKDLKLEWKLVQSELKKQLLQVADNHAKLKDSQTAAKEIELAYLEVLKIDLEDAKAKEYFREKGTLDETVAALKKQGFPKVPFAKNIRDRGLGLPPQQSPEWDKSRNIKLRLPAVPGAKDDKKSKKAKGKKGESEVKSKDKDSKKDGSAKEEKSADKKKKPQKKKYRPITVKQVLLHHERQFKVIAYQEKNAQKKKTQIQPKWIARLKELIESGTLDDDEVKKAYRQIVKLDANDADAKKYFKK